MKPDTPVQCYGPQASEENHRLVEGRTVRLVFDRERRDVYGRLLAYVYTDAGHGARAAVRQRELVRGGYARRSRSRRTPPTPRSWAASQARAGEGRPGPVGRVLSAANGGSVRWRMIASPSAGAASHSVHRS